MTDIWIINGIPGVGKSTTAHALAARHERGIHIEGDKLQEFIVSGSVPPGGQPSQEEKRQIHLNVRNQCLLARSFAGEKFIPVLDYVVVNRARVEEYHQHLMGLSLHLVTLAPGALVAVERDRRRPQKTVAARWTHLDEMIRAELNGVGLWIDNSTLSVEETVSHILQHKEAAKIQ